MIMVVIPVMRLSLGLRWAKKFWSSKQLNQRDWRKIWETGYWGPSLSKKIGTDRPDLPIGRIAVASLRSRLEREYHVMKCLASPYLTKEKESPWLSKFGSVEERESQTKQLSEYRRMPNKAKVVTGRTNYDKIRGNIGNLLHSHRSVEDDLAHLIRRRRFD